MSRLNLAILISGRGTNMDQILRATTSEDYPARARLVLSNREDAAGLEAAHEKVLAEVRAVDGVLGVWPVSVEVDAGDDPGSPDPADDHEDESSR